MRPFKLCGVFLCLACLACHSPANSQDQKDKIEPGQDCINKIIEADERLGAKRNHDCETLSLSETIEKYVGGMEALDFSQCPEKFSSAFKSHIEAWKSMVSVTDHFPDSRGEMHDLFNTIEKSEHAEKYKLALDKIWSTWSDVEVFLKKD